LGNARVNFRANGTSWTNVEEMSYYPFGLQMENAGTANPGNKYLYNGKERNEEFGLNLYDYGARWYDAALGRWGAVDPMAEKYFGLGAYHYGINNPVRYIDLFGMASANPSDVYEERQAKAVIRRAETNAEVNNRTETDWEKNIVKPLAEFAANTFANKDFTFPALHEIEEYANTLLAKNAQKKWFKKYVMAELGWDKDKFNTQVAQIQAFRASGGSAKLTRRTILEEYTISYNTSLNLNFAHLSFIALDFQASYGYYDQGEDYATLLVTTGAKGGLGQVEIFSASNLQGHQRIPIVYSVIQSYGLDVFITRQGRHNDKQGLTTYEFLFDPYLSDPTTKN
jgi:RHS repeat-associated protein